MRRWFTGAVAAITIAWPLGGQAQQLPHKVGFLGPASPEPYSHILEAFREGLKDAGFTEGQNLVIEYRWANDQYERLPTLAAELVQQKVEVIFTASGTQTAKAAQAVTSTIPIVFVIGMLNSFTSFDLVYVIPTAFRSDSLAISLSMLS